MQSKFHCNMGVYLDILKKNFFSTNLLKIFILILLEQNWLIKFNNNLEEFLPIFGWPLVLYNLSTGREKNAEAWLWYLT